jgi:hypothetical protein
LNFHSAEAVACFLSFPPHKWDGNEFWLYSRTLFLFIAVWLQPTAILNADEGFSQKVPEIS